MLEICRARERLEAYKVRPYPSYPPEPQPAEEMEIIDPPTIRYYRPTRLNLKGVGLALEVEGIRREVLHLKEKIMELRAERAKRKYKY